MLQMRTVEADRQQLADKVTAQETASQRFMADKLAQLEAQLAAKDAQLQQERATAARFVCWQHRDMLHNLLCREPAASRLH